MTTDNFFTVQNKRSSVYTENGVDKNGSTNLTNKGSKPKLIDTTELKEGEIAINNTKGLETIQILNSAGEIIAFNNEILVIDSGNKDIFLETSDNKYELKVGTTAKLLYDSTLSKLSKINEDGTLTQILNNDGGNVSDEELEKHIANKQNPHNVTPAQLGLGTIKDDLSNEIARAKSAEKESKTVVTNKASGHVRVATTTDPTDNHQVVTISENDIASQSELNTLKSTVDKLNFSVDGTTLKITY